MNSPSILRETEMTKWNSQGKPANCNLNVFMNDALKIVTNREECDSRALVLI